MRQYNDYIFKREIFRDATAIQSDINEVRGDIVGKEVNISELTEGESYIDSTDMVERKVINGKIFQQKIKDNKIYWEEI